MKPVRVVLADDHPVVRIGLQTLLNGYPDIELVGEAEDGEQTLAMVEALRPDVLILDIEMPGMNGDQVMHHIRLRGLPVHVLVLSAHDHPSYIRSVVRQGAAGFLVKGEDVEEIVEAIRAVAQGKTGWVSRSIAHRLFSILEDENGPKESGLTRREREVLTEMVAGKTNPEIAVALGISEKTVEKHSVSIYSKLGVKSRTQAVVMAVEKGWY